MTATSWVLATDNAGKLREIRALLGDTGMRLLAQGDLGVTSPEETGRTFLENALLKAVHAARVTGLPAIGEDSGLAVDALDGAPGVYSARFAGPDCDDRANIARLLDLLARRPDAERTARFQCCIVAVRGANDPAPLIATGEWTGTITHRAVGRSGFGYDPVFFDPLVGSTAAEMAPEVKNRISHRARAIAGLRALLAAPSEPPES